MVLLQLERLPQLQKSYYYSIRVVPPLPSFHFGVDVTPPSFSSYFVLTTDSCLVTDLSGRSSRSARMVTPALLYCEASVSVNVFNSNGSTQSCLIVLFVSRLFVVRNIIYETHTIFK
jgi:hypothetical protein